MSEIKALEWRKINVDGEVMYRARKPFGSSYYITELLESYDWNGTTFDTLEAAQAAAQSDYEARIRSALVERKAEPWGIVRKGSDGDVAIFSTKFNTVKARFTAGNALRSGEMLYPTPPAAPVRVTEKMIDASAKALAERNGSNRWEAFRGIAEAALTAALSASPSPVDSRELIERLTEALQNANGFLDTPVARRRHKDDPFYDGVVQSIRDALAAKEQQP